MRRLPPCELAGSMRLKESDGTELFAGVRIWITDTEVGIVMNDGNGGPAERVILTELTQMSAMSSFVALARRRVRVRRFQFARLYPQTQEVA